MLEIKTFSPKSHRIKCLIYGASGTGKTTFGGSAENVIFASVEDGLLSIADKKVAFTEIRTLKDFEQLRDFLRDEEHNFETLVIDSITEINSRIKDNIEKNKGGEMTFKEWGEISNAIKGIILSIKELDMHVIIIAQEKVEKDGENIQKILPSLNGQIASDICYSMDIVGYIKIDNKGERRLITEPNSRLLTKDRTGKIGNDTEMNFTKWIELVSKMSTDEGEVLYTIMTDIERQLIEKKVNFQTLKKSIENSKTLDELKINFNKIGKGRVTKNDLTTLIQIKEQVKRNFNK